MTRKWITLLVSLVAVCNIALADLPFRNHRYDAFKVLPKQTSENIVFIGNSITNMHEWWEAFGNINVQGRGVSGAVSDEVVANLGSLINGTPGKVFLMIGTNDLGTNGINTAAHVMGNVRIIVNYIKKVSPATDIYIESILPSNKRNQALQQETNTQLKAFCEAEDKVTYVDLWDALLPVKDGNANYTKDGLHLTGEAYRIWCKAIEDLNIGLKTTYRDTDHNIDGGVGGSEGMLVTSFSMLPVKDGDILLIGDEMVHGGEWQELLGSDKVKNRGIGWGYPGSGIETLTKTIPGTLKGRDDNGEPAKIFIYAGTSDVNNGNNAIADIKAKYQTLVNTVRNNAPNAQIYLQALLPNSNANHNTTRVVPFNNEIKAIAAAMENVTYVDDYTPLASNGVANTAYFNGNYLYGKGYAKVASILAGYMGDDITAKTEAETNAQYELLTARNTILASVNNINSYAVGTGIGQYPADAVNEMKAKVDEVYTLLRKESLTAAEVTAKNNEIALLFTKLNESINMPLASTTGNDHWYKFYTPQRDNRYMTSNGAAQAVTGDEANNYAKSMWKLVDRGDGTFNIVNRKDNTYLSPASNYNTAITTVATAPAKGWTFSYSNAAGTYIISSGEVQLNQTQSGQGYKVFNWSGSTPKGQDRNDTGCRYAIEEVTGQPEEEPVIEYTPRVALTNITLDGTKPYKIDDRLANRVYALDNLSVAIDFTYSAVTGNQFLVASSNSGTTELCAFGTSTNQVKAYTPNKDSFYSRGNTTFGTNRHQVVVTLRKGVGYTYYIDGNKAGNDVNFANAPVFGTVNGVDGLYLGGVVTSEGENIMPATGTIHSVRFFDHVFTAPEVAALSYDDIEATNPEGEEMEIRISTGTLRNNNGAANQNWNATWTSTATDPTLTLNSNGKNNMTQKDGFVVGRIGSGVSNCTYTISVPEGYIIKGWSMDIAQENTNAGQVTVGGNTYSSKADADTHVEVTGLNDRNATFVLGGNNSGGLVFKNFFVTVVEDTRAPEPRYEVFVYNNTGETAIQSRIPAITTAQNGNVIVASDYRYSGADIGMSSANDGKIDLRYRVSKDNGKTWSEIKTLAKARGYAYGRETGDSLHAAFGDPCLVADRESNRVMALSCSGMISFPNGQRTNHQGIARIYSDDNGETWDTLHITDISAPIYAQFDKRKEGPVRCMFIGSGKISQSNTVKVGEYYRLYCAALVKTGNNVNTNFVLYSDDFGGSWNVLGGVDVAPIPNGGDEPKADELPDGSVIISSRATGGRYFNIYTFTNATTGEGYWSNYEFSGQGNQGTAALGNSCNGEIMFVPVVRKRDSKPMYLALQSVPMGPGGRKNVGIYYKGLESPAAYASPAAFAPNWEGSHQASSIGSAYSTMTWQKDNTVGFLFEEETYRAAGGYTIVYKNYSVEQITDSLYTFDENADREAFAFPADALDARWEDAQTMVGTNVGNITEESLIPVETAYNNYKSTPSQTSYEAFAAAIDGAETVGISTDVKYRLRNSDRQEGTLYLVANTELTAAVLDENSGDQLFSFIPTEEENVFYVANEANEVYIGQTGANETKIPVVKADTITYRIDSDKYGRSSLSCTRPGGSNSAIHLAGDCTRLVPWVAKGSPALFNDTATTEIYTVIEAVPARSGEQADAAIYDLSGRRVARPAAGVYIRSGKKYIIKK